MSDRIKISDHIATLKSTMVEKVCRPLFRYTDITYFCYLRRYPDGLFTFLPSMIDVGAYLFGDGQYPWAWFAGIPYNSIHSGYMLWDIARQVSNKENQSIGDTFSREFKLSSGLEIIEWTENYCEFFSFSGPSSEVYFIPLGTLYKFIYYFRQECHDLIQDACGDRLQLYNQINAVCRDPIMQLTNNATSRSSEEFDIKRYYLSGEYDGVFLTKREMDILNQIEQGGIVKSLADILCVSPRTLEHHIANIKSKLAVSSTTALLKIARTHNLIV